MCPSFYVMSSEWLVPMAQEEVEAPRSLGLQHVQVFCCSLLPAHLAEDPGMLLGVMGNQVILIKAQHLSHQCCRHMGNQKVLSLYSSIMEAHIDLICEVVFLLHGKKWKKLI